MFYFIDESGDLGFRFIKGSSKYFTISIIKIEESKPLNRLVRKIKIKYGIPLITELKGSSLRPKIKEDFLIKLLNLPIEIYSITVKKENIETKLRKDVNLLYNYMVNLILIDKIKELPKNTKVNIIADNRITSLVSGLRFEEYLKYKILYEFSRTDLDINIQLLESHRSYPIQAVDIVVNSIFKKYNRNFKFYNIIKGVITDERTLYF